MTASCATCYAYVSGDCRLINRINFRPDPDYWCTEFQAGTSGDGSAITALTAIPAGAGTIIWAGKANGTVWLSVDNGTTWTQTGSPG